MKKLLLTACAVTCAVSVFAQGSVVFNNRVGSSVITKVYLGPSSQTVDRIGNGSVDFPPGTMDWSGYTPCSGGSYMAALIGAAGTADPQTGSWGDKTTTFRTGNGAGWINSADVKFSNIAIGAAGNFQMFVWDNTSGNFADPASALLAWKAGTIAAGFSNPVALSSLGGGIITPPNLSGLQSFSIYTIPEPSTMALAGLGAAAMLIFRRRK